MLNNVPAGDKHRQQRVQNAHDSTQIGLKRVMQKIVLYARIDKEHLRRQGEALGIKSDALTDLMYFTEVRLNANVDTQTGAISNVKVV